MGLTSYLPDSPERLSTIEGWLYFIILLFSVLTALSGYVAVQVRGYRASLEKKDLEKQLARSEQDLSATRLELDDARKNADSARRDAERVRQQLAPRDVPSEKRAAILRSLRREKGRVHISYLSDPEAAVFATRLGKLIREAGWEATEEGVMGFGAITGLRIEIHDPNSAPSYTSVLKEALELAFDNVVIRTNADVREDGLVLTVGSKAAE